MKRQNRQFTKFISLLKFPWLQWSETSMKAFLSGRLVWEKNWVLQTRVLRITPSLFGGPPDHSPECSHRVWSRNGREGCSDMLHDIITEMIWSGPMVSHDNPDKWRSENSLWSFEKFSAGIFSKTCNTLARLCVLLGQICSHFVSVFDIFSKDWSFTKWHWSIFGTLWKRQQAKTSVFGKMIFPQPG